MEIVAPIRTMKVENPKNHGRDGDTIGYWFKTDSALDNERHTSRWDECISKSVFTMVVCNNIQSG